MSANPFTKQYLMAAGPTPVPEQVLLAMAQPVVYHRAPAFLDRYVRTLKNLKKVFQTENEVLVFSSSGSGAMESAAANLVSAGMPVLVASCGKFGDRWAQLCQAFNGDLTQLKFEWGTGVSPDDVDRALSEAAGKIKVVFTTQSETSTGVVNDVKALTEVCHAHGSLICVDAVSGMGAVSLPIDEWGVDVVVSGSQKALMTPPGLGFAAVNEKALELAAQKKGDRFYFDWKKTRDGQLKDPPGTPFTPAVSLLVGLDEALQLIEEEGLANVYNRHALLGKATRAAAYALGLGVLGPDDENAGVVTAVKVPEAVDGGQLIKSLRDRFGVTFAGGQDHLKGKIVRVAHCGYFGAFDIITSIAALEMALAENGADIELGVGVAAAQQMFTEAGVTVNA